MGKTAVRIRPAPLMIKPSLKDGGFYLVKISILLFLLIFIIMRPKLNNSEKRIKISITLSKKINEKLENDLINKSKLIDKLLSDYYDNKNL